MWHASEMISQAKRILPGVLFSITVGVACIFLAKTFSMFNAVILAIIAGAVIANTFGLPEERFGAGLKFSEKRILEVAIICIGAELQLGNFVSLGFPVMLTILAIVIGTIMLGPALARRCGTSGPVGILLSVGLAICGSSAIVATAPLVKGSRESGASAIAIGAVNIVGLATMLALPPIAIAMHFNASETGLFMGATLPSVNQLVGSSFAVSPEAGIIATAVKMARVSLLVPVLVVLSRMLHVKQTDGDKQKRPPMLPFFVVGFAFAAMLRTADVISAPLASQLAGFGEKLIICSMVAVGTSITPAALKAEGRPVLIAAFFLVLLQVSAVGAGVWLLK